jgi:ABC-type multidrug transport system fused ATPase/permease subunit
VDSGKLMSLSTNDTKAIGGMYIQSTNILTNFASFMFIIFILAGILDLFLAILLIPFIPAFIYAFRDYRRKLGPYADEIMQRFSNMATTLQDGISGAEIVRAFSAEKMEKEKFGSSIIAFRDTWIGQNKVQALYYPRLVASIAIAINFIIGGIFVYNNFITLGILVAFNLIMLQIEDICRSLNHDLYTLETALASASRIFEMIDGDVEEKSERIDYLSFPDKIDGKIEFKNVTFYHGNNGSSHPILNNVSFTIEANQRVAIVGPTGCGKTTIAKLLLRFYKPQEGCIHLDGIDLEKYRLAELRHNIGYIEQDIYLFPRTIQENIKFGKPQASMSEISKAAKIAQIHEFVEELDEGYQTQVGDRGTKLSGGQRQRIAIARALIVDPKVLILDDASSAIDSETEEKIVRSMENVLKNRSTLVITHRLHAIQASDKILVLKRGRIVAEGNHEELVINSNDYRRIFGKYISLPEQIDQSAIKTNELKV